MGEKSHKWKREARQRSRVIRLTNKLPFDFITIHQILAQNRESKGSITPFVASPLVVPISWTFGALDGVYCFVWGMEFHVACAALFWVALLLGRR